MAVTSYALSETRAGAPCAVGCRQRQCHQGTEAAATARFANWKLPLQIAQHAGGGWPEQARRASIYLSRTPYEPSMGVQLLAALRAMFAKNRTQITSEQVVQELLADPDSQWHEYRGRGPITKNQVAALLKDFEIRPVVVHPTKRADVSRHGYRAAQFEDAFARFLPPEPNIRTLQRGGGEKT